MEMTGAYKKKIKKERKQKKTSSLVFFCNPQLHKSIFMLYFFLMMLMWAVIEINPVKALLRFQA